MHPCWLQFPLNMRLQIALQAPLKSSSWEANCMGLSLLWGVLGEAGYRALVLISWLLLDIPGQLRETWYGWTPGFPFCFFFLAGSLYWMWRSRWPEFVLRPESVEAGSLTGVCEDGWCLFFIRLSGSSPPTPLLLNFQSKDISVSWRMVYSENSLPREL